MKFTADQCIELQQLKDMLLKCEVFKAEVESVTKARADCISKRKEIMARLNELQSEIELARKDQFNWQQKLDKVKTSFVEDSNHRLQILCLLLGFQISKCHVLENEMKMITLHYRDICFITFSQSPSFCDVVEIYPQHPNFLEIRKYLQESQDLRGLLTCLRTFFDFAIKLKEKMQT